jgi:uncharacterized protein (DUF983 family)
VQVEHFQALEGKDLEDYRNIIIVGFILAGVIFVEKVPINPSKRTHSIVREHILEDYRNIIIVGFILAGVIFVEKVPKPSTLNPQPSTLNPQP